MGPALGAGPESSGRLELSAEDLAESHRQAVLYARKKYTLRVELEAAGRDFLEGWRWFARAAPEELGAAADEHSGRHYDNEDERAASVRDFEAGASAAAVYFNAQVGASNRPRPQCRKKHCSGLICGKAVFHRGDHEFAPEAPAIEDRDVFVYRWAVETGHLYAGLINLEELRIEWAPGSLARLVTSGPLTEEL